MMYLTDRLEIDSEISDYIKKHACVMNVQANPIALLNKSSIIIYANRALFDALKTDGSLPTLVQLNNLYRGVRQSVASSISENKPKTLQKVVRDNATEQLIPYQVHIRPVTHKSVCKGALVYIETDIKRLVDYFIDEKSTLSNKIFTLNSNLKNTFNLVTALFDNSPVGMMILDEQNKIMQINKNGLSILDVKAASVIGVNSNRFYSAVNDSSLLAEERVPEEVYAVTWTGEKKILMRCSVECKSEDVFSVETFVDVTEIERARFTAEEANKAKTEFLENMSHELRTPLHAIMGFSQCGIERGEQLDVKKANVFFNHIYHGGEILLALINDLLDVAKLGGGKVIFNNKPVQIDELVKEVVNEFEILADSKEIKINVEVKNIIKSTNLDEMRMMQVVRNILNNAVKFSKEKDEVTVELEQMDEFIQLRVYDHGPGIPDDELESIFEKFIQSSRTNTGAGGSGLGLAICRDILNHQNGAIWAENKPEGGAAFIVNLFLNHNIVNLMSSQ